jgi:small subunit ribosomal protein S20
MASFTDSLAKYLNESMPNTKSAERRMRNSHRKHLQNTAVKSRLRRAEKEFRATVVAGKKDEAAKLLASVHSAFDKAVKVGAITRPTANRKKSRLALSLK